ncbi:MAG: FKBP-type peptidyl-prolyl cis-trans isomerase [Halothiobacillaceae bacterium]
MKVGKDKVVGLEFEVRNDLDELVDSSEGRAFEYLHGYSTLVPGLEQALEGREAGETFKVTVEPEEAYGLHDPAHVISVSRDKLDPGIELVEGNMVETQGPYGRIELMIVKFDDEHVWLDANHPLAGVRLHFNCRIGPVREAHPDEIKHKRPHPGGHHLMVSDSSYWGDEDATDDTDRGKA